MENNVKIQVLQRQDHEIKQVIYEGVAQYEANAHGTFLRYEEKDGTKVQARFTQSSCWIVRKGEYVSNIHLNIERESYIEMKTEYGEFHFDACMTQLVSTDQSWSICYQLLQQDDVIGEFHITWIIKEALA
ncbi:MAG: DUF1934 family protein [Erysipelotrichaceae bacterium]|nr:DUF1934 family protein [Erysipelotrichaceae bacterium]